MLEEVYDLKLPTPTHGFFGIDLSCGKAAIGLRDFGVHLLLPSRFNYVGHVEPDWFYSTKRNDERAGNVLYQLPPKLFFNNRFLDGLFRIGIAPALYTEEVQSVIEHNKVGNLKWYKTFQPRNGSIPGQEFVHCTMQGHNFAWHLQHPKKTDPACESVCHTTGLWRD